MVVDAHTHIFPPEVASGRERFFSGEPEFRMLYASRKAKMAVAGNLIESMDENGIDYSVVFGFPWRGEENLTRHNDYVIESAARHPDRLIAFACLDLSSQNCLFEAQRRLREGVAGFGELAIYSAGDDLGLALKNLEHLADLCRENDLVLLAHANEPIGHKYPGKAPFGLDLYYAMAKAAAGANLILAHWGGGLLFFELLKKDAPDVLANVYYDTAASPFLYRHDIYPAAARIAGEGKILFGSDYPLISPKRYFEEMMQSGLTASQINAVSGGNAARLFGLKN
ncbi:MAG: amidohydrolase family protein [Syntrophobacteraceae bacterium]